MTFAIFAKNSSQAEQSIIRGGRLTVVGSGGFTETDMIQGGLANYEVPSRKSARIRGTLILTSLGTDNTFIQVQFIDNQSGRTIPVARATVVGQTVTFDIKLAQVRVRPPAGIDMQMNVIGDGVNDGTAEWQAQITELPL